MGLWDAVYGTTDALKNASHATYNLSSSACSASYNLGLIACRATYDLGSKAVNTVKDSGVSPKVKEYIPGSETQEKISSVLMHPLTCEVSKLLFPASAAPACDIVGAIIKGNRSGAYPIQDDKKYEELKQQVQMLQANHLELRSELEHVKEVRSLSGITSTEQYKEFRSPPDTTSTPLQPMSTAAQAQKPEDVMRIFMMKGCKVTDLLDNQVVPVRGKFGIES